ncbi:MAG: S1-C subfamily serine protease, partial [Pirellulaceae bacterium]
MATCTSCQTPFQIPDPSSHASPLVDLGHQNKLTSNPASTSVQQQPIPNSDSRLLVYGLLGLGATMFVGMLFIGLVIYVVSKPTDGEVVERPPAVENSEEGEVVSVPPSDLVKPSTEDPSIPTRRPPISAAKLGSLPDFSVAKRAKFDTRFRYFWPKHSLECVFEIKASLDGRKFGNEAESKITGYTTYSPSSSTPESILKRLPKSSVTKGIGSGFVVHPDGIIVTCEHVVSGADNINVTLNGKQYQGRVIDSDAERDLAILKIDATDLPYLEIASSKSTRLTEQI